MAVEQLWLGFGNHPDLSPPEIRDPPGAEISFPLYEACESAPLDSQFVAAVAWDLAPGRERREGYFIEPSPLSTYAWVLWDFSYDDNWGTWSWRLRAATDATFETAEAAAQHLLGRLWAWEKLHHATDRFDEIEERGLLSEDAVMRIADRVWSP